MANVILKGDALKRLKNKYGEKFPDPKTQDAQAWQEFFKQQKEQQESQARDRRLHYSRHRNFRVGNQWITSRDGKTWREPGSDKNTLRPVDNCIGPALDFRLGIIGEQSPGFRHDLLSGTIKAREVAEAQQAVSEHYFRKLKAYKTFLDAGWHAQTDGVCFVQVWVDPLAGRYVQNVVRIPQDDERYKGFVAQGYQVEEGTGAVLIALDDEGKEVMKPGAEIGEIAEGDLATRVVLAHDTMVDAEARQLNGGGSDAAKWFLVRRPRDVYSARIETGDDTLQAETFDTESDPNDFPLENNPGFTKGLPPFPSARRKFKEGIYDYTIYIAPDGQDIPNGMWRRVIGNTLLTDVKAGEGEELPGGVIPFARFTDGSPDPSFYPRPVMSDWIGDQVAINALEATIMQHGRILGIGRLLALKGTMLSETYNAIIGSVLEYEGIKPEQLQAQRASVDLWQLLQFKQKSLENKTGWNDTARGQVNGQAGGGMQDVSGRAVLAAQEALERTFGPMVDAMAAGASEWAEIVVKTAGWLYGDTPRQIENVGGRGDLAKLVSKKELEGECLVYVDKATLMPMPSQLRQQMLEQALGKGLISLQTYAKRSPYGETRNMEMGDLDHWQRAQWVNAVLEENWKDWVQSEEEQTQEQQQQMVQQQAAVAAPQGMIPGAPVPPDPVAPMPPMGPIFAPPTTLYSPDGGLPILWQDDPAAHLAVLNELILDERKPWALRKLAIDRSTIYEQLAQAKSDPSQPVPAEVLGIPLNRLVMPSGASAPGAQLVPQPASQPAAVEPGAAQSAVAPSVEQAQPLGTVGVDESDAMRQ